ncbi:MAG: hypothetical protein EP347_12805 [Alphaproteobacteria bacterium]|nr:MAG: hypothetical protein EP347_12805 [Alphaproteobacteria bacterium]
MIHAAAKFCAFAAALMFLTAPAMAAACYEAPDSAPSFRASVDQADNIVLVKITSGQTPLFAKKHEVDFDFEVLQSLKGNYKVGDTFRLRALWVKQGGIKDRSEFKGHWDPAFWDRQITRLDSVYDCGQELAFDPNNTYLLFDPEKRGDRAPLAVTAEEIFQPEQDRWLSGVRQLIDDPTLEHARSKSGIEYLKSQRSVALAAVESCSDKLRPDAHYVAEVQTLSGAEITRDQLDPETLAEALKGCDGFTVVLGIFYGSDRETGLPIDVDRKPMQQYVLVKDGQVTFTDFTSEIGIQGPKTLPLEELVAGLLPVADQDAVED